MTDPFLKRLAADLQAEADTYTGTTPDPGKLEQAGRRLRNQRRVALGGVALLGVAVIAVGSLALRPQTLDYPATPARPAPASATTPTGTALVGSWLVTAVDGKGLTTTPDGVVVLHLREGAHDGASLGISCHPFNAATFTVDADGALVLSEPNPSISSCTGARADLDRSLRALLLARPHVSWAGQTLTLTSGGRAMTAELLDGPSTGLAGTWRVVSATGTTQPLLAGGKARLTFGPGGPGDSTATVSVDSATCVGSTAEGYAMRAGRLVLGTPGPIPAIACRADVEAETRWLADLVRAQPSATLDGDRLTLSNGTTTITARRTST